MMSLCPNCGTEYEGAACPKCVEKWSSSKVCPHCNAILYRGAATCPHCGYAFEEAVSVRQPNKAWEWTKKHKKAIIELSILVALLAVAIPLLIVYWYSGTYYRYQENQINYEQCIRIVGRTWTTTNVTGTFTVKNNQIVFSYNTGILGIVDELKGTIGNGTIVFSDGSVYKREIPTIIYFVIGVCVFIALIMVGILHDSLADTKKKKKPDFLDKK